MKKSRIALGIFALGLSTLSLASCGKNKGEEWPGVIVKFNLEGGVYQNCENPIVYYYHFNYGTENKISDPETLSKNAVIKAGYKLDGWYQTKTVDGDSVLYSDKWDFTTDKVGNNGVTLYAKWKKNVECSYTVCYTDEKSGELIEVGSYETEKGSIFSDYSKYASKREGYTYVGYFKDKECTEAWDDTYTFPEAEENLDVKVYVKYIEGNYTLVRTAKELTAAKSSNIYLMNDIDMAGASINFGDYKGVFEGNNHTISNFNVSYKTSKTDLKTDLENDSEKSLYISLFEYMKGATLRNVSFSGMSITVDTTYSGTYRIRVSGLARELFNTTISNVTVNGTVTVKRIPSAMDEATGVIIEKTNAYLVKDTESVVENVTIVLN